MPSNNIDTLLIYLEGMETIAFVCFVVNAVRVRLAVHCSTTSAPLRYVSMSPFFCFFDFIAAGRLHSTVPVRVVRHCRSSDARKGLV